MRPQRPASVLVMGVLSLVFGALGLIGMLCGALGIGVLVVAAQNAPPPPPGKPDVLGAMIAMFRSIPGFVPYILVTGALGLIASIVLIVAGVGLLNMRPWARRAAIGYGIYAVFATLGGLAYNLAVIGPAAQEWEARFPEQRGLALQGNPLTNIALSVVSSILGMAFGVAMLIVMFQPHVRAAIDRASRARGAVSEADARHPRRRHHRDEPDDDDDGPSDLAE